MVLKLKETVEIHFEAGDVVLIERRDLPLFASYSWYVVHGRGQSKYLIRNSSNRTVSFHSQLMGPESGMEIDHINRNGLDNRRANLRFVTHQQNQNNLSRKRHGTSRFRYVHRAKEKGSWCAMVTYGGRVKNIGHFDSEIEAAHAANNYIIKNKMDKVLNEF